MHGHALQRQARGAPPRHYTSECSNLMLGMRTSACPALTAAAAKHSSHSGAKVKPRRRHVSSQQLAVTARSSNGDPDSQWGTAARRAVLVEGKEETNQKQVRAHRGLRTLHVVHAGPTSCTNNTCRKPARSRMHHPVCHAHASLRRTHGIAQMAASAYTAACHHSVPRHARGCMREAAAQRITQPTTCCCRLPHACKPTLPALSRLAALVL